LSRGVPVLKTCPTGIVARSFTTGVVNLGGHGPRTMVITPSRYQWQRFKDVFHFYIFLGVLPGLAIVLYANIFIGPAKLADIPEGYEPKHWEYQRHPISRFLARYVVASSYQQDYERNLHYISEEAEQIRMRKLSKRVEHLMQTRGDYPNYYGTSVITGKYIRYSTEENELIEDARGND